MSANPIDHLVIQALQQRNYAHETIGHLKDKVVAARARLDPQTNAREHLLGASLDTVFNWFSCRLWLRRAV
jgi:hypothetical protein